MSMTVRLSEQGKLPDFLIRTGIRWRCLKRLWTEKRGGPEKQQERFRSFLAMQNRSSIAVASDRANEQHYELPPEFFLKVLGSRLKYSCCFWPTGGNSLDRAEEAMLDLVCRRAGIQDGMRVLELGCGWGSLSLWLAEKYPECEIVAVSNSQLQRDFILTRSREHGLGNLRVITDDMNYFQAPGLFDRIVSVEMFEHMRNWGMLLSRIASWLAPDGKLFIHVFSHRNFAYTYEAENEYDWMAKHFFTGGIMPSQHLMAYHQTSLAIEDQWTTDGLHYKKTLDAWLENMDRNKSGIMPVMAKVYGKDKADVWFQRWRIFFMACSEMFGYARGGEWIISHYLLKKR